MMIHFAVTVADLPDNCNYTIYGDDEYAKFSKILLKKFEHSVFDDISSLPESDNISNYVIVSSPQWPILARELSNEGREVIILLHPEGNPWGYYGLTKNIINDVKVEKRTQIIVPEKKFYDQIARQTSILIKDGDDFKVYEDNYYPFFESLIKENNEKIDFIKTHFNDSASRDLFAFLLGARFNDYIQYYLPIMFSHIQYMDYINLRPGNVVINGGVETGFEIPYFTAMMGGKGEIHCIDPLGFDLLIDYVKPCVNTFPNTVINHRLALMDYNGEVELGTEGPQAEIKIVQKNKEQNKNLATQKFPCITIDSFVENHKLSRVDLIKLDLEGADTNAILGGLKTISKYRPQLAISIYHFAEHFFRIPYYFMETLKEYYFFLGHYSYARWETVLYAIPKEKLFPKKMICQL